LSETLLAGLLLLVELAFCLTGEVVLWVVTLGRRSPRWDLYTTERPTRFVLLSEASIWIGGLFWLVIALGVHRLLGS
jgi:hypothetical protein